MLLEELEGAAAVVPMDELLREPVLTQMTCNSTMYGNSLEFVWSPSMVRWRFMCHLAKL